MLVAVFLLLNSLFFGVFPVQSARVRPNFFFRRCTWSRDRRRKPTVSHLCGQHFSEHCGMMGYVGREEGKETDMAKTGKAEERGHVDLSTAKTAPVKFLLLSIVVCLVVFAEILETHCDSIPRLTCWECRIFPSARKQRRNGRKPPPTVPSVPILCPYP